MNGFRKYSIIVVVLRASCTWWKKLQPSFWALTDSNWAGTGRWALLSADTGAGLQCSLPEKSNEVPREPAEVSKKLMLMDPLQAKDRLRITQYQHNSTLSTALRVLRSESEWRLWHLSASQPCYYCLRLPAQSKCPNGFEARSSKTGRWIWTLISCLKRQYEYLTFQ